MTAMPPLPVIRGAGLGDGVELAALDGAVWSPQHAVAPRPQPPYPPFFDDTCRPADVWVAEVEDAVAGYVRVVPPTPLVTNRHVRQIQGLAVAPWARGRGVARELLRAAAAQARRQGAGRMTLRVLAHNTPARRLYSTEGYQVEGVLPGEFLVEGTYVDDVLMGRDLTAPGP